MSFDPLSAAFNLGKVAIEKIWPDKTKQAIELRKLEELHQAGDLARLDAHISLMIGQMEINKEEAKNPNIFISGWRPFTGWMGGFGFAYAAFIEPIMRFAATMSGYEGEFPVIDTGLTIQVLMGMLGLGAMRSYDKRNGVDTKTHKQ